MSSPSPSKMKTEAVPPIPTPTYPKDGLFTVLTTITIDAPLQDVLDASLDYTSWPKWNTFVPLTTLISQPSPSPNPPLLQVGTILTFHSRMKRDGPISSTLSNHEIVCIEEFAPEGSNGKGKAWRVVWKTVGIPGGDWMLRAERVQEFVEVELDDGTLGTRYRTWGTFGGPLAHGLSWSGAKGNIVERFGDWAEGLKTFVEDWK